MSSFSLYINRCRLILILCLSFSTLSAQEWMGVEMPKQEVRAVWLTTVKSLDWPKAKATSSSGIERQKQELRTILDKLHRAHINTVILQTRLRGTMIYPSKLEPWDECLTGKYGQNPGYDPLAFAIEECHKRGMELHAWLVTIPLGPVSKQRALGNQSIIKRHPELCKMAGGEYFMVPSAKGTADYVASLCREIVENYDVDGISLDYVRYPETTYGFKDAGSAQQKRDNITRIVQLIHDEVKSRKPWVKLSSSPIGKFKDLSRYRAGGWNAYHAVYQDAQGWLRDNLQDMLFPMMYFLGNNFYPFLYDWQEHAYGHPVVPGLGIYFLDPREGKWTLNDVRAQMHSARKADIGGVAFFRSDFFTRNCKGLYDCSQSEFFAYPALTPRMTWMDDTIAPPAPSCLKLTGSVLSWEAPTANESSYPYYNVYGANVHPVDVSRAENLLRTRVTASQLDLGMIASKKQYFAVTACDRFGNESPALQEEVIINLPLPTDAWNPNSRLGVNGTRIDDRMQLLKQSKSAKGKSSKGKRSRSRK